MQQQQQQHFDERWSEQREEIPDYRNVGGKGKLFELKKYRRQFKDNKKTVSKLEAHLETLPPALIRAKLPAKWARQYFQRDQLRAFQPTQAGKRRP